MPNYDLVSAWRFVEKRISDAQKTAPALIAEFRNNPSENAFKGTYLAVSAHIYQAYEKFRKACKARSFDNQKMLIEFKAKHGTKWNIIEQKNNLHFLSSQRNIKNATTTRLSIQLNPSSIQYVPNDLLAVSKAICSSAENIHDTNAKAMIDWKFVEKKSIGGRIDDIVIYIEAMGSDILAQDMGKALAKDLAPYLEKKSWGIPGAVKICDGIYYAGECRASGTTWWSPSTGLSIKLDQESHGGSLGGSCAIAILDAQTPFVRQFIFNMAFAHFRSGKCLCPQLKKV